MINPLDELSQVYLNQISEECGKDGCSCNKEGKECKCPEGCKKCGCNLKEENDLEEMHGGTMSKLGPREKGRKDKGKKKPQAIRQAKARTKALKQKLNKESFSDWRQDLREVINKDVAPQKPPMKSTGDEKIKDKKVKNKVVINPSMNKMEEVINNMGGILLEGLDIPVEQVYDFLLSEGYVEDLYEAEDLIEHATDEQIAELMDLVVDLGEVEEGYKPTNFEKNERQAYKHRKAEEDAVRRGDEEGANKHMKRRTALGSPLAKRTELINQGKGPANEKTRKARANSMKESYDEMYGEDNLDEDSRRMSNKQHTARVRSNIKDFGSNYTPPSNYDPDANRGKGEVLTRKQMEKKRRKSLRQEELEATGAFSAEELEALQEKMSAMDIVKKQVTDKYGKGAIYDPKAPKKKVSPEEKARRKAEEAKNRADRRKEAGYDPMHSKRD
jgi:hypothetical protein